MLLGTAILVCDRRRRPMDAVARTGDQDELYLAGFITLFDPLGEQSTVAETEKFGHLSGMPPELTAGDDGSGFRPSRSAPYGIPQGICPVGRPLHPAEH